MAFPPINYKKTNTEIDDTLEQVLEEKLQTLEKFIGNETDVKCEVEFEKTTPSLNGPVHRVEINFWLRGQLYRAEATEENFREAIDRVHDEIEKEIRRAHKKRESRIKWGHRRLKEMLRFGR